eukprot:s2035_g1.t1
MLSPFLDWFSRLDTTKTRQDFLVESCARNLQARRRSEGQREDPPYPQQRLTGQGGTIEEEPMRQLSGDFEPTPRSNMPTSGPPTDPQGLQRGLPAGTDLAQGVLEHIMREVIAEEEFGSILDKMLSQEVPFFMQYEDSTPPALPPPDHPAAPEASLMPRQLEDPSELEPSADEADEEEEVILPAEGRPPAAMPWSDLLLDFQAGKTPLEGF